MKQFIKKWLGLNDLEASVVKLNNSKIKLEAEVEDRIMYYEFSDLLSDESVVYDYEFQDTSDALRDLAMSHEHEIVRLNRVITVLKKVINDEAIDDKLEDLFYEQDS